MISWEKQKEELLHRLKEDELSFIEDVRIDAGSKYASKEDVRRDAFWVYLAGKVIDYVEAADNSTLPISSLNALLCADNILGEIVQSYEEDYDKFYGDDVDNLAERAVSDVAHCYISESRTTLQI